MNLYQFKIEITYNNNKITCYWFIYCTSNIYNQIEKLLVQKLSSEYDFKFIKNQNPITIAINSETDKAAYYSSEFFINYQNYPGRLVFIDVNHGHPGRIFETLLLHNSDLRGSELEKCLPVNFTIHLTDDYFRSLKMDR